MDPHSEERLKLVHPELARRVTKMAEILAGENIEIRVVQGLRTWDEQKELWLKGRDPVTKVIIGPIVTKAAPGHSWHQFGLAVDVTPFDDGKPDWNADHPEWKRLVAVGKSLGLESGSEWRTFPDWPHFQLTGKLPISPTEEVRKAFLSGGIAAVWAESEVGPFST